MFGLIKPKKTIAKRPARAPRSERRELVVSGRALPLVVTEHARSTRLTLRIDPGGRGLRLTVPIGVPAPEIDRFLDRHQAWLMTKLARFPIERGLEDGAILSLRGVDHRIRRTGRPRSVTETEFVDGEHVLLVGGAPEHLRRRIRDFLKREAERDLEDAVYRHARTVGRKARSLRLKDTKSRWGSCTTDGDLSFSWRIVMAPPHVIDYLAAHEVAHLKEMNHGPRFWALCGRLCPDMEPARKWLKNHGTVLHAIDFG